MACWLTRQPVQRRAAATTAGLPAREGNQADPARDATTLPLIRRAIARAVPLFAICRGVQELNVALGGSLHQEVHELPGPVDHRSDKTLPLPERYGPAHQVRLTPGGMLQALFGGAERIEVNSLHGQAIDRLAPTGWRSRRWRDDGTIEAVRVQGAPGFALAVQWHPEWGVLENPGRADCSRPSARPPRARRRQDSARPRGGYRVTPTGAGAPSTVAA